MFIHYMYCSPVKVRKTLFVTLTCDERSDKRSDEDSVEHDELEFEHLVTRLPALPNNSLRDSVLTFAGFLLYSACSYNSPTCS